MIDRRTMLAAAAALGAGSALPRPALAAALSVKSGTGPVPAFPKDFLWGAATAGHQVEGNNVNADIWLMENVKPTTFAEPSGDAANSFELWRTDLDLVKGLGLNTYRFSLEWARIEPQPGQFSIAMLDHYKAMIEGCRERGIAPMVTFNHFTTPRWFAGQGGWHHPDAPSLFARYCDRAARHLAGGISRATTLNEPNLAGLLGELLPGDLVAADKATQEAAARAMGSDRFSAGSSLYVADPARFRANQIAGHKAGRAAIKAVRGDLPVGVSLAMMDDQAVGPNSLRDAMRERFYGEWLRAAQADDFVGVQNYERKVWSSKGLLPAPSDARRNTMGAEVWPGSLAGAVRHAHAVAKVPVIVTEHGVGTDDDTIRAWLIPAALRELKVAIDEGVPVLGYVHWSLIDNFEWLFGYRIHFGLHTLDRQTFRRTAKPSAAVLADIARRNSL
ncbi:family 1 glycosylhydrolase [Novosphingobium sp. FKTRR1]|uniref:family 1 glycosylhydrolase n=1 Tax=Novosphingobium sp. FKTRR1 TaxID=2879118 RepID=UPI001CF02732|nr:family 1 glycosylhydrolase [Novosphingobium sp. FKTRR1]